MKKLFLLLLVITLSPLAYSEIQYTEVFFEEVKGNADFTADDKPWGVWVFDTTRAKITFPSGKSDIMAPGDCTFEDNYNVCLTLIRRGDDNEFNITTQQYPMYAKIRIEKPEVKISIGREFEKSELFKGETTEVMVTLKNEGSVDVLNADYRDAFPQGFEIISASNCDKEGSTIRWQGSLYMGKERKFSYTLKAASPGEYTSYAELNYVSGNVSDSEEITVSGAQLEVITEAPEKISLGHEANITVSLLNNNSDYDITSLRYKLYIPESFKVISKIGFTKKVNDYQIYSENLVKSENTSFLFTVRPEKTGKYRIKETTDYTINNMPDKISSVYDIEVFTEEVELRLTQNEFPAGESASASLVLTNPSNLTIKNIDIALSSDLIEPSKVLIQQIRPQESVEASRLSFVINDKNIHYINVSLNYQTYYNQMIRIKSSLFIHAVPEQTAGQPLIHDDSQSANQTGSHGGPGAIAALSPGQNSSEIKSPQDERTLKFIKASLTIPITITLIIAIVTFCFLIMIIIKKSKKPTLDDVLKKN